MGLFQSLAGLVTVRIETADTTGLLSALARESVDVYDFCQTGDLSAQFRIYRREFHAVRHLADRRGIELHVISRKGIYWYLIELLQRPVLLLGLGFLFVLAGYLPGKILFIQVDGNRTVPERKILECAQECGLTFGKDRRDVRSEKLKNGLLEKINALQWVGVNTSGCVATISVRERAIAQVQEREYAVSSIVAAKDGIIISCTGTKGNVLCRPGQAVKAGEVLISGYTDCGISIRAEQAQGDVYAQTSHALTVLSPAYSDRKGEIVATSKKYGLIIGKKRINFYKDSGILPQGCDKIYSEYYIMLPGGYQLPVAIVEETWYTYDSTVVSVSEETAQDSMTEFAHRYLQQQMLGGQILQSGHSIALEQDVYILQGNYVCLEMIGRVRSEEIIKGNGEDH